MGVLERKNFINHIDGSASLFHWSEGHIQGYATHYPYPEVFTGVRRALTNWKWSANCVEHLAVFEADYYDVQ